MTAVTVRPCGVTTARQAVARLHRHRPVPPPSARASFEALNEAGWPVGWAMVGNPSSRVLQQRGYVEVTRVAIDGTRNACSALYGACSRWAKKNGYKVVTYTLQSESGASLRGAGWVVVGTVEPRNRSGWANRPGRTRGDGLAKLRWSPTWCAE